MNKSKRDLLLLLPACFAWGWAVARACLQSVTIDEADSYLEFASPDPDWAAWWYPSSGNHVLHSILARLFTSLFGLSHLTLRAAALAGAAIYIAAIYCLCCTLARDAVLRRPLFVCLVFNPFVMDYMAAARGYSLALGLLCAALCITLRGATEKSWIAASALIGLSLTANFSFGYVDAAALTALTVWACSRTRSLRMAAACILPALAVAFAVCGHTLLNFPRSQLYYGAASLREMWHSIAAASFDELNPYIVNPLLMSWLKAAAKWLPGLFAALGCVQGAAMAVVWLRRKEPPARELRFGMLLAGVAAAALAAHWLAFRIARVPLPMARTGIFFVPLGVLFLAAAGSAVSRFERGLRAATVALLQISAVYFAGCMRLSYFKEWQFDADVQEAFGVIRRIHHQQGVCDMLSDWRYSSTLNFYRRYYGERSMPPFTWQEPHPEGKQAYVVYFPQDQAFLESRHLKIVYKSRSDLVIAVR